MRVHLVDGTFELFRCFFGAPSAKTSKHKEVGATRALLRSFAAWLRAGEITHAGCAFDHVIESFRNDLFKGYKTGEGLDPDLYGQFELAERAAAALGFVVWPMVDFEADDAIATAAAILSKDTKVKQIEIWSPDKDLCQCVVGERIVSVDRLRKTSLTEDGVHKKFGVGPSSIPDLLGLVGDSADGIPGIQRWGQKTASAVLATYKTIEAIPADHTRWTVTVRGAATLSQLLEENRQAALLYKRLATLRRDVPLDEQSVEQYEWRGPNKNLLAEICDELEDDTVMKKSI